jgi:peptidoglycan/xylan/chitin deacetylase (PgdA/CDA1 family)
MENDQATLMKRMLLKLIGWASRKVLGMHHAIAIANWLHGLQHRKAGAPLLILPSQKRFQILNYHRILPRQETLAIDNIAVADFEKQVDILTNCFRVISLVQLVREVRDGTLEPNTVCITFDDGYRDNFIHAYPILLKYGISATIFLATGVVENPSLLWHDKVFQTLKLTRIPQIESRLNGKTRWRIDRTDERTRLAFSLLDALKRLHPEARDLEIEKLMVACEITENQLSKDEMLSWREIQEMHHNGIAFGAHTVTHPILSLLNENNIASEISESKRMIEDKLGESVEVFAYPNGQEKDYDERTKHILRSLGFRCALTTRWGMNTMADDPFEWRRARPWEFESNKFFGQLVTLRMFGNEN